MDNLIVSNVTKSFGTQIVFENFSYTFEKTGLFHLQGESGKGKTTLLRLIAGIDTDYIGTISAPSVSFLFQDKRLFPTLNVLDNITLPHMAKKGDVVALQKEAKDMLTLFHFTEEDMKKYPHELSGGMAQRVAIVRAILYDAPVLLLDEPAKELDAQNREVLFSLIAKEAERRLVIMVSHDGEAISTLGGTVIRL